jgi:hypothetical protein
MVQQSTRPVVVNKGAFSMKGGQVTGGTTYVIHPGIFFIENVIMPEIFQPSDKMGYNTESLTVDHSG